LHRNPDERIGAKDKNEIKNHPFFAGIDWDKLLKKEIKPPYLDPIEDDELDIPLVVFQLLMINNIRTQEIFSMMLTMKRAIKKSIESRTSLLLEKTISQLVYEYVVF